MHVHADDSHIVDLVFRHTRADDKILIDPKMWIRPQNVDILLKVDYNIN